MDEITRYIESCKTEQRDDLILLRNLIEKNLQNAQVDVGQFPVWIHKGNWLSGFAGRAKGPMFYLMNAAIIDEYGSRLGKLRTGKSCILFKPGTTLNREELLAIFQEMLRSQAQRIQ